jgi:hypothetical protein
VLEGREHAHIRDRDRDRDRYPDRWPTWVIALFALAAGVCFILALVGFVSAIENKSRIARQAVEIDELRELIGQARIEVANAEAAAARSESRLKDAVHTAAADHQAYEANIKAKLAQLIERTD